MDLSVAAFCADVTPQDMDAQRIHRTLDGPKPYTNPLSRLIAKQHYDGDAPDLPSAARQKAATKRLKARRQAEWLGLFAVRKGA